MRDGETGFVVDNADEMVAAVGRLSEIDPSACRKNVERRFDAPTMASNYLQVYRRILDGVRAGVPASSTTVDGGYNRRETEDRMIAPVA